MNSVFSSFDEAIDILGVVKKRLDNTMGEVQNNENQASKNAFHSKLREKVTMLREKVEAIEHIVSPYVNNATGGRRRKSRKAGRKARKTRRR
jgi:hypothetical protein